MVTLPALRQDMHTFTRRLLPPMLACIDCRFGLQRRLVCRFEWLTLNPVDGPLPQMSHFAAIRRQR